MRKVYKIFVSQMINENGYYAKTIPLNMIPVKDTELYGIDTLYHMMGGCIDIGNDFDSKNEAEFELNSWLERLKEEWALPPYNQSVSYSTVDYFLIGNPIYEIREMYIV